MDGARDFIAKAKARAEQQAAYREAVPWHDELCPEGRCSGFYIVPLSERDRIGPNVPPEISCPHAGTQQCRRAADAEVMRYKRWMLAAGFGERYIEPDAQQVRERNVYDRFVECIDDRMRQGRGLLVCGGVGVGKTMALAYIATRLHEEQWVGELRFLFCPTLFDVLHRQTNAVDTLGRADLLMIDDFGREYQSDWGMTRFESLMEARYASRKPVLITTNLTPAQLAESTSWARWVDRWRQTCEIVLVGGKSQRQRTEAA